MNAFRISAAAAALAFSAVAGAQTVGFATLPPGSILHAQASVIAKAVQDHSKLQVRVIGYGGDTGILESVASKKADFWLLDVGESADAFHGRGTWKGNAKPNLRTAITMYGFQMAFWVRKDSNINAIADLKGKRVPAEWVQQTGVIPHTTAVLAAGGITYNDVVKVPEVNVVRAADDFKAGKLDLLFFAVGAPKVAEVAASVGGLRLLPMSPLPDSEARMKKVRPEYYYSTVRPAPHIAGVDAPSPVQTIDVVVGVGAHVPDAVVYQFVKAMRENKKDLVAGHPNFNQFDPTEAGKVQQSLPHHPGAIRYFKEAGIWKG
ncbi:MAG: TAXI family TRAP transporter solute-binding subunit [Betaproteobacteria bacterium]|nr:MAG: TAXI family TRAP transporter solute-binding subunit [Betaproteobacteria bacterium]